jgi:hypothetical protein
MLIQEAPTNGNGNGNGNVGTGAANTPATPNAGNTGTGATKGTGASEFLTIMLRED